MTPNKISFFIEIALVLLYVRYLGWNYMLRIVGIKEEPVQQTESKLSPLLKGILKFYLFIYLFFFVFFILFLS